MSTTIGLGVKWEINAMDEYTARSGYRSPAFVPTKRWPSLVCKHLFLSWLHTPFRLA